MKSFVNVIVVVATTSFLFMTLASNNSIMMTPFMVHAMSMNKQSTSSQNKKKLLTSSRITKSTGDISTNSSRRDVLRKMIGGAVNGSVVSGASVVHAASNGSSSSRMMYKQRFPVLFSPLYGESKEERKTTIQKVGKNIWILEQNLVLGPLETPLRCVVIQLEESDGGGLWVHAPLAPTEEFFDLVESCGVVKHVIVPTYALEHKVYVKDAIVSRWSNAQIWTSPGQFSFPIRSISDESIFGKQINGILSTKSDRDCSMQQPPWIQEIAYETLSVGTFYLAGTPTTLYETAFYHKSSQSLIVTDSLAQIQRTVPSLNDISKLLLISKKSTSDPMPENTLENQQIGWEKTALLISYFFPEHEEFDNDMPGVVTWTDGWHDNFQFLSGRLIVPPVVRTLLYSQNPHNVQDWVDRIVIHRDDWNIRQIIPAHWEAPIPATKLDIQKAFAFLTDNSIDAFPTNDLKRGLAPIASLVQKGL